MTDPAIAIDEALATFDGGPLAKIRDHVRFEPAELGAYRETFAQMGLPLPASLELLLSSRGLLRAPDLGSTFELPSGSSGFHMLDPDELLAAFLHLDALVEAGVEAARSWVIFATVSARRYEGAYAFIDEAGQEREPKIGYYASAQLASEQAANAPSEQPSLPETLPGLDALLLAYAEALIAAGRRGDRAALSHRIRTLGQLQEREPEWQRIWTRYERGKLEWSPDTASSFAPVLARTDDPKIAEKLLAMIEAEFEGYGGRGGDPALHRIFARGEWPRDYPGPNEVLARLPLEGKAGLRGLCRFCLEWAGLEPRDPSLIEARAALQTLVEGGAEALPEATRLEALGHSAGIAGSARGLRIEPGEAEAFYARALTWSLGPMSAARARHVATLCMRLSALARTAEGQASGMRVPETIQPFSETALFQKVASLMRGAADEAPSLLRPRPEAAAATPARDALAAWLADQEGSQAEKLGRLESEWAVRLRQAGAEDRERADALLRKKINSKKLKARLDAFLRSL
ncbi:MAG: hypothetical protein OEY14_17795 [Myxococcales bacterium]|nr:hypothetical protein [Myxococcales bacterium]